MKISDEEIEVLMVLVSLKASQVSGRGGFKVMST